MGWSARFQQVLAVLLLLCCGAIVRGEDVHILADGTLLFNRSSTGPRNCPLPGYCERQLTALPASAYVGPPADEEMARQKANVTAYLSSSAFQAEVAARAKLPDEKGLLFVGGGPSLIGMITVKLYLLRNVHKCMLPVEIAYYGDKELDNVTLATLQHHFDPVYALDLSKLKEPAHQHNFKVTRYTFKVMALQFTRFKQVLFIDADNMPLKDPSHMFESPQFVKYGNLLWPDYWRNGFFLGVSDQAYSVLGLNKSVVQPLFDDGSVLTERAAESGSLLIDRVAHADVLEYLVWINSFDKKLDKLAKGGLMGDKDTFKMAFALAGKGHMYMQMPIPPGIGFSVGTVNNIESKIGGKLELGWTFNGMSQYDHLGDVLFFHHTAQKWANLNEDAVRVDVITGPTAMRWVRYYLAHDNLGPKRFTVQAHAVPLDAIQLLELPPASLLSFSVDPLHPTVSQEDEQECPWHKYVSIVRYKSWGLPITPPPELVDKCRPLDGLILRMLHKQYGPSKAPGSVSGGTAAAGKRGAQDVARTRRRRRRQQRSLLEEEWHQQQQGEQEEHQFTGEHGAARMLLADSVAEDKHQQLRSQAPRQPRKEQQPMQRPTPSPKTAGSRAAGAVYDDGSSATNAHAGSDKGIELPGTNPTGGVARRAVAASGAVRMSPALDEAHRTGFKRVLHPRYVDRIYWMNDGLELRDGTPLPALRINVPVEQGGDPRLVTLDLMQQVHVPQALAWLRSNYDRLPLLKST